jgi:hypothetical protein
VNQVLFRVAWYRFRAAFGRRWGGYLAVVLLVALLGGLAMGAISGARRTQSFYPTYLANTNPSDLVVSPYVPSTGLTPALANGFAHLPHVKQVAEYVDLLLAPLQPNGLAASSGNFATGTAQTIGSADGLFFRQDRVTVVQGRMANPNREDEFVTDEKTAQAVGWHVGQTIPFGAYTIAQASSSSGSSSGGPPTSKPHRRFNAKLVGIVVFNNDAVVHDDVDHFASYALFTPALTRSLIAGEEFYPYFLYGLQLDHGDHDVASLEREVIKLFPTGTTYNFYLPTVAEGQVERAIKPETIAIGVFGAIVALAALVIASQAIGRQLHTNDQDLDVLRALGANPTMIAADDLIGVLGALFLGSFLAAAVAVGLSPLAPIGAVREVDPSPGTVFDWEVLGIGLLVLIFGLGALTLAQAYWRSPDRLARREMRRVRSGSTMARVAASSGLPPTATVGIGFAVDPGRGRTAVPVRSALCGAALAVLMVVATLTFGSSLQTLVSHPALYGWNWTYALEQEQGGDIPPQARALLSHDPNVAAWTSFGTTSQAEIDGQTVPIITGSPHAQLTPPILTGHALDANNQIVLGPATLAQLHKRVGDTVLVSYGSPKDFPVYIAPTPLVIVGTATMPAIGQSGSLHPSMGTGAVLSTGIEPVAMKRALTQPDPTLNGPSIVVVKMRSGVSTATGLASMQRIARVGTNALAAVPNGQGGGTIVVLPVQHPAEIVNYRSIGTTPAVLVSGLAAGTIVALGLILIASVRRRRRDLALLKMLGFSKRQLAATIAWQASIIAAIGTIVGTPLGVVLGRWLWTLFAREIYAVPEPTIPALSIVFVILGALVLTNIIAFFPGRIAARTKAALVLRAE